MYPPQPPAFQPPPPFHPPAPPRRWWQHSALIICLLVVFPPAGIALVWTGRWSQNKKIIATVLGALWFLLFLLTDSPEQKKDEAKADPKPAATAAPTPTPTPTPTPSPTEDAPAMPQLVGGTYADAEQLLKDNKGRAYGAYKDVVPPADAADWTVCFQRPDAGAPVRSTVPVVYLTEPGVPCPKSTSELLHKPTPKPTPTTQKPKPTPTPEPTRTRAPEPEPTEDAGDGSSGGGGSVSYRNCAAVRAAGAAPIHAGDPGYGRHLDRDGDGVGCEG
ncbi:excalibur calcium-binding domain-containing protein [Streptomyces venezuelae]|uniref:excalibur calcium-binding domain-containing protein n=1 Tax=Streptomyces venezuelae TaxID=54571 RepID=UPI0037DC018A